jgi:hypothetical protein
MAFGNKKIKVLFAKFFCSHGDILAQFGVFIQYSGPLLKIHRKDRKDFPSFPPFAPFA